MFTVDFIWGVGTRVSAMIALSERGRVAVTDVLGRGAARAAAALGRRIGLDVALTVPTVDVLFAQIAADLLDAGSPDGVLAVTQRFDGAIEGAAAIAIPPASQATLAALARIDRDGAADVGRTVLTASLARLPTPSANGLYPRRRRSSPPWLAT